MTKRQFDLKVFRKREGEMGLIFSEKPGERKTKEKGKPETKEFRIWGTPLKVMAEVVLGVLKKNGYRPTELSLNRKEPFILNEASGVRLGLFFYSLKPLRKVDRMESILSGIDRMGDEEAYYWFAKCTNGRNSNNARRALRILLAGE